MTDQRQVALDSVTEDAIRDRVTIPPHEWPQAQRRAYLGGAYTRERGGAVSACPYTDSGCAEAWRRGYAAAGNG